MTTVMQSADSTLFYKNQESLISEIASKIEEDDTYERYMDFYNNGFGTNGGCDSYYSYGSDEIYDDLPFQTNSVKLFPIFSGGISFNSDITFASASSRQESYVFSDIYAASMVESIDSSYIPSSQPPLGEYNAPTPPPLPPLVKSCHIKPKEIEGMELYFGERLNAARHLESSEFELEYVKGSLITALSTLADVHPLFLMQKNIYTILENDVDYVDSYLGKTGKRKKVELGIYNIHNFREVFDQMDYFEMMVSFDRGITQIVDGKSGSLAYVSKDKKYMAKTLSLEEFEKGRCFFKELCEYHVVNPSSLLTKYAALIRVWDHLTKKSVYLTVMPNIMHCFRPSEIFDLKGCSHGLPGVNCEFDSESVKNDLKFVKNDWKLYFSSFIEKIKFLDELNRDTEFLQRNNLTDYSLLVGYSSSSLWTAGIVNLLTPFTKKKNLKYSLVGALFGYRNVSCSPPAKYAARFKNFLTNSCLINRSQSTSDEPSTPSFFPSFFSASRFTFSL